MNIYNIFRYIKGKFLTEDVINQNAYCTIQIYNKTLMEHAQKL